MSGTSFWLSLTGLLVVIAAVAANNNETAARIFLDEYNTQAMVEYFTATSASWAYSTNITDYNQQKSVDASLAVAAFEKDMRERAVVYNRTGFSYDTNRQLEKLIYIGDAAMESQADLEELTNLLAEMETRYSTSKACKSDGSCYALEPDLTRIMAESRDYSELYWAWDAWRDTVGNPARGDYQRYVELKNLAAQANDQPDNGAYWRSWYEVDNLEEMAEELYNQLTPLYNNLHAYVRRKLYNVYGGDYINLRGPIPAHVLGNMWAQSWLQLDDICQPYPNKPSVDITPVLKEKGYTPLMMFEVADEFFSSLGLIAMPQEFWNKSMIERPDDGREVVCHASAWDFYNQKDFRVKQCTDQTMDDFITIHHEMGHVEYYLQYKDQPVKYRRGANPGFHEAVGDVLSLSVSTPGHLAAVGLLDEIADDEEADLNFLMSMALDKIAFLPFGYLMDQWRWRVFDGSTPESMYNSEWWKLRLRYQGIIPPVERTEDDFDPGAKYHIPADVPYIRYFISFVIQFQFHDALCQAANHTGPLHKCDIYNSQEAGTLLANMLQKGSSEQWPEAMEAITGTRTMNASALISYFEPLIDYLEQVNQRNGDVLGWPESYTPADPNSGTMVKPSMAVIISTILLILGRLF